MTALCRTAVSGRMGHGVLALPECRAGDALRLFFLEEDTLAPLCPAWISGP